MNIFPTNNGYGAVELVNNKISYFRLTFIFKKRKRKEKTGGDPWVSFSLMKLMKTNLAEKFILTHSLNGSVHDQQNPLLRAQGKADGRRAWWWKAPQFLTARKQNGI